MVNVKRESMSREFSCQCLVAKVVISARGATKHLRAKKITKLASSINRLFMTSILIDFSEFFIIVYNKVKVLHVSVTVW